MEDLKKLFNIVFLFLCCIFGTYAWSGESEESGNLKHIINDWKISKGVVLSSSLECRIVKSPGKKDKEQCKPLVLYGFKYDSIEYLGQRVDGYDTKYKTPEYAKEVIDVFSPGTTVDVYHHPNSGNSSTLIIGKTPSTIPGYLVLLLWVAFAVRIVFIFKK